RFERRRPGLPSSLPASSLGAARRTQPKDEPGCESGDGDACPDAEHDQVACHETSTSKSFRFEARIDRASVGWVTTPTRVAVSGPAAGPCFAPRVHCAESMRRSHDKG